MISSLNQPSRKLQAYFTYEGGPQQLTDSLPTFSNSPIKSSCPPHLVNSLKCLQKIFQKVPQEYQSVQQQLSLHKVHSLSPSMSYQYNSDARTESQSNHQSTGQLIALSPQQSQKFRNLPIQQGRVKEFKRSSVESIYYKQESSNRKVINDFDIIQKTILQNDKKEPFIQTQAYLEQIDRTKNSYRNHDSTPAQKQQVNISDTVDIWKERYFALQERQTQRINLLEDQLKKSEFEASLSRKMSSLDNKQVTHSYNEIKSLQDAQYQSDRILLQEKNTEKDVIIKNQKVTIKRMDGQLTSYQKIIKNLNAKNSQRDNELEISKQNQIQFSDQQEQKQDQIKSEQNVVDLVLARSLIDKVLSLLQTPTKNLKPFHRQASQNETSIPLDISDFQGISQNLAIDDPQMIQSVKTQIKKNVFGQKAINKMSDSFINISQVIKDSLVKRNPKK